MVEAEKILRKTVDGSEGDWCLYMEMYHTGRSALSAGPEPDEMDRDMIPDVATSYYSLRPSGGKSRKVGLAQRLCQSVTPTSLWAS